MNLTETACKCCSRELILLAFMKEVQIFLHDKAALGSRAKEKHLRLLKDKSTVEACQLINSTGVMLAGPLQS